MTISASYDVVIAGGGPAGSTLAALLTQRTQCSVALFESAHFPREHIGESFAHRSTTILQESGALAKVMASDCWIKKHGGYYAWGDGDPAVSLFEHGAYKADEVYRWSVHVNRPEFDHVLLNHARDVGTHVEEGVGVSSVTRVGGADGHSIVTLTDGRKVSARIFVEATGRATNRVTGEAKAFLSNYRNIALWTHVVGGLPAQSAPGDWNVFREEDLSAIGSFAFDDGWFWYIPVRRMVDGKRVVTHSIGMVTDPRVLKDPARGYNDMTKFMETARRVPILKDLVADAHPTSDKLLTATNYSMISSEFCSFEEGWIAIGDSAYFVDPLFSSGIAFAVNHAASACLLIKNTLEAGLEEQSQRQLWGDYHESWNNIAQSFGIAIDQWYHAIAKKHPESIYWQTRADDPQIDLRESTFNALVDTGVSPDLLLVISANGQVDIQKSQGPLGKVLGQFSEKEPHPTAKIMLRAAVELEERLSLDIGVSKTQMAYSRFPRQEAIARLRRYWDDPLTQGDALPELYDGVKPALYFFDRENPEAPPIKSIPERDGGRELADKLRTAQPYGELREHLGPAARVLLEKLVRSGMAVPVEA